MLLPWRARVFPTSAAGSSRRRCGRRLSRPRPAGLPREQQTVCAGGAGHDEVPVHECAEESSNSSEQSDNQCNNDQEFAVGDKLAEPNISFGVQHGLNEIAIPINCDGGPAAFGNDDLIGPIALEGISSTNPSRVVNFMQGSIDPRVA